MKIEADDKEVQDIFSLGIFKIPRFQRPYSWGKTEVDNFWNDIINDTTDSYFIGSMVVYQTKKPQFGIVDGQQRLTTITIVLSVIRDAFVKLNELNLAKGVHKYIEKPNNDYVNEFVLDTETSFPYLQKHIQSFKNCPSNINFDCDVGSEETNLKLAYDILSENLESYIPKILETATQLDIFRPESAIEKLKNLRDKFLSLKLVFIQLDNEDDAYLIFETLNARGRDLKTSDLVKNLLLKTIKTSNTTYDSPKQAWNTLIKGFDDISEDNAIDTFLLHYWISNQEYTTEKKLFAYVKDYVLRSSENAKDLLENLNHSAIDYCKMLSPENTTWSKEQFEIRLSLESLNSFKVKQQSSFVLSLLSAHTQRKITLKQLKTVLNKIEHFHFVFNAITQQRSSGSIASMYSQHAINLSITNDQDEIQRVLTSLSRKLEEKLPSYEEFEVKFLELTYLSNRTKSKSIIKYALRRLVGNNTNGLDINHENLTIEHLIPEAKIKTGTDSDIIGSIGNLILTDSSTNSHRLKDKDPVEKIAILKQAGYPLSKFFLDNDVWNEKKVIERTKELSKALYPKVKF